MTAIKLPRGARLGESREHRLHQTVAPEEHIGVGLLERTQPDIGVAIDDGQFGRTVVSSGQRRDERFTECLHRIELLVGVPCRGPFDHIAGAGAEVGRSDRSQPHRDAALVDRRRCAAQAAGESAGSNRHLSAGADTDRLGVELAVGQAIHVEVLDRGGDLTDDGHERCGVDRCADERVASGVGDVTKYAPAASRQQSVMATRCSWVTARMRCASPSNARTYVGSHATV